MCVGLFTFLLMLLEWTRPGLPSPLRPICDLRVLKHFIEEARDAEAAMVRHIPHPRLIWSLEGHELVLFTEIVTFHLTFLHLSSNLSMFPCPVSLLHPSIHPPPRSLSQLACKEGRGLPEPVTVPQTKVDINVWERKNVSNNSLTLSLSKNQSA